MPAGRRRWMLTQYAQQALYPHLHELALWGHTLLRLYDSQILCSPRTSLAPMLVTRLSAILGRLAMG